MPADPQPPLFEQNEGDDALPGFQKSGMARRVSGEETFKKSVDAILVRPKEGKISLLARRFYNVLLHHAQRNPAPEGTYHKITLSQLGKESAYSSRDVQYLVQVVNSMLSTVVNWGSDLQPKAGNRYQVNAASLLSFVRITKEGHSSAVLEYDFHKEFKASLLNPKIYAVISLEMNAKMRTYAALQVYELVMRYKTNPSGVSCKGHWKTWAQLLTGNPDLSPTLQYKYFARDVLRPALKEVNLAQNDYLVDIVELKVARRVEGLQFVIQPRKDVDKLAESNESRVLETLNVEELTVVGRLTEHGIAPKKAEKLVNEYGVEKARWALRQAEERGDKVRKVSGYLITLMEEGVYEPDPEKPDFIDVEARDVPTMHGEGILATFTRQYLDARKKSLLEAYNELPGAERAPWVVRFEKEVLPQLNVTLQKAWATYRPDWDTKPMNQFIGAVFKDLLIKDEPAPSADEVMSWAYATGLVQLASSSK